MYNIAKRSNGLFPLNPLHQNVVIPPFNITCIFCFWFKLLWMFQVCGKARLCQNRDHRWSRLAGFVCGAVTWIRNTFKWAKLSELPRCSMWSVALPTRRFRGFTEDVFLLWCNLAPIKSAQRSMCVVTSRLKVFPVAAFGHSGDRINWIIWFLRNPPSVLLCSVVLHRRLSLISQDYDLFTPLSSICDDDRLISHNEERGHRRQLWTL